MLNRDYQQTAKRNIPGKGEVVHGAPHASTYVSGLLIFCTATSPKFSHHIGNFLFVHLHDIGMIRDFSTDNKTLHHMHLRCVTVGKIYIYEGYPLVQKDILLRVGQFSVHAWRECGGLNKKPKYVDSLCIAHFGMPRGATMNLALNEPKLVALIQTQTLPSNMHHRWEKFMILWANNQ